METTAVPLRASATVRESSLAHRDTRQLASNALSQSTALGHTCLVAGAVGSDDQRSSAGEGIGHFESFVSFMGSDMRVE